MQKTIESYVSGNFITSLEGVTQLFDLYALMISFNAYLEHAGSRIIENLKNTGEGDNKGADYYAIESIVKETDYKPIFKRFYVDETLRHKNSSLKWEKNVQTDDIYCLINNLETCMFNLLLFKDEKYKGKKFEHTYNMARNLVAFYDRHKEMYGSVLDS